jgi:subtilase family protein
MNKIKIHSNLRAVIAVVFLIETGRAMATTAVGAPPNLGGGLRTLAEDPAIPQGAPSLSLSSAQIDALKQRFVHIQLDNQQRVLTQIYLDGTVAANTVKQHLTGDGVTLVGEAMWYRSGALAAWVPLTQLSTVATTAGVRSVHMALAPRLRVGQTTSQGVSVMKADLAQTAGYTGKNIKIGALSDTFNLSPAQDGMGLGPDNAQYDAVHGDLPGPGNPNLNHQTPVTVVQDLAIGVPTDEGRGMLQLIHDVAPDAQLAFATANGTQINFANNIRALGTSTNVLVPVVDPNTGVVTNRPGVGCNIVVDDVIYFLEPMYSDGIIAQAIDDMAVNYGVVYFSSAGNDGNEGYESDWRPVTSATGLALATVPGSNHPALTGFPAAANYAGGFHNFNPDPSGTPIVVQKVVVGSADAPMVLQWNDPFDNTLTGGTAAITTDYNFLVFNAAGAYQSGMSSVDNNYSTNEPYESPGTDLTAGGTFYIVITRRAAPAGITPVANRLRYVAVTNGGGFSGDFIDLSSPATFGHCTASNSVGTAAYVYDDVPNVDANGNVVPGALTPSVESFSSNGPIDVYFDRAGNRLIQPIHRNQPALAAPDGANTSFFPGAAATATVIPPGGGPLPPPPVDPPVAPPIGNPADYDGDHWPNFFGTSAAAPHAAAAAALILQAANDHGLGPLNPRYVRNLMQSTTQGAMDSAPGFCAATASGALGLTTTLSGTGDNPSDPNTFKVTFAGPAGYQLISMTIDLTNSGLEFDPDPTHGAPFAQGTSTGGATLVLPPTLSVDHQQATLSFLSFDPGDTLDFGVDRDVHAIHAYGNGVDQLQGSTFAATLKNTVTNTTLQINGTFTNDYSNVYNFKAGYGLIDVNSAINTLLAQ